MANSRLLATDLPIQPILEYLNENPSIWSEIKTRQEYRWSPHKHTESVFVRGPTGFTPRQFFSCLGSHDYPAKDRLDPHLAPLFERLIPDVLPVVEMGRVLLVDLKAGKTVRQHIDMGEYADHFSRFHVVLSTNSACINSTGGQADHWKVGECWWFNHKRKHFAANAGDTGRIHLILDAVVTGFTIGAD